MTLLAVALVLGAGLGADLALAMSAEGDDAPALLEQIVVVATKRESSVRDVAADVTVISAGDMRSTLTTSLAQMFRFVPGVTHETSGSRFGTEGITIRGIGGNRVALELDGVPLSDQFDIGNFSNATRDFADTGLIGHVEVLRGPASALYGSNALGGVVSMRTPDPRLLIPEPGHAGDALLAWRGEDDSVHATARLGFAGKRVSALLVGNHREGAERDSAAASGSPDRQDTRRNSALLKLAGDGPPGHTWQVSAIAQRAEVASDITSVLGTGRFASTTRLEGDDEQAMNLLSGEYAIEGLGRWVDEARLRVFRMDVDIEQNTLDERAASSTPELIDRDFFYDQRLSGAELNLWREAFTGKWSHRLGLGLEWTSRRTEELRDGLSTSLETGATSTDILGESFPLRDFPTTTTEEFGAYVSDHVSRGPLTLMMALRFDRNRLKPDADAIYREDNPATDTVDLSDSDISPKLGAVWRVGTDVDLYVQYAHGFRAPQFEDANIGLDIPLFNIRAIPNPDLRSETSDGWELGLRWQGARSRLQLGLFRTDYEDFIETKMRIGTDPESGRLLFQSRNIGRAVIRGAEARFSHRLGGRLESLSLHASAYLAEGENRDNGEPLNSVGPAEAVLGLDWRAPGDRTEVQARLTVADDWSKRDETGGELFRPAGYGVVDLYLTQLIGARITLRAGITNVTDRTYWRWSEVRGLAPGDPLLPALAEAGRSYSVGLQWDW